MPTPRSSVNATCHARWQRRATDDLALSPLAVTRYRKVTTPPVTTFGSALPSANVLPSKQSQFSHRFHKYTVIKTFALRRGPRPPARPERGSISVPLPRLAPRANPAPRTPPGGSAAKTNTSDVVYVHRCHFVLIISLDVNFIRNGSMDFWKTLYVFCNVKSLAVNEKIVVVVLRNSFFRLFVLSECP